MKRRDFLKTSAHVTAYVLVAGVFARKASADETAVIVIKGTRLVPDMLTVKKGQKITIADKDNTHHSIYSETPGMEVQCPINPGGTGVIEFGAVGTVTIECAEHPTEIGTITVV